MNEYTLADIEMGLSESFSRKMTAEMEDAFRSISGDTNPMHYDDDYAKTISDGKYDGHISFGMLTASLYSTLSGVYLPGKYCLIHSIESLSFMSPVKVGDELTVVGEVIEKNEELRLITVKATIKNQYGTKVSKAKIKIILMK